MSWSLRFRKSWERFLSHVSALGGAWKDSARKLADAERENLALLERISFQDRRLIELQTELERLRREKDVVVADQISNLQRVADYNAVTATGRSIFGLINPEDLPTPPKPPRPPTITGRDKQILMQRYSRTQMERENDTANTPN